MAKKKFRLTTCNICGAQAPANFMVRAKKAIKATSRNTVGGKEVIGSILGFETSQKALKRSVLTSRKRTHTTYRTVWMCEDCSGEKSIGTREQEALYYEKNALLKECEICLADIEYLRETSIPDIKSQFDKASEITKSIQIDKEKLEKKQSEIFPPLRKSFDKIKSKSTNSFYEKVSSNILLKELLDKLEKSKKDLETKSNESKREKEVSDLIYAEFKIKTQKELINKIEEIAESLSDEEKKIGTSWENKKLYEKLKFQDEFARQMINEQTGFKQRKVEEAYSSKLILKYKDKSFLENLFNEKHADIHFNSKKNKFELINFAYKEDSLAKLNKNVPNKVTGLGWGNGLVIFFGGVWTITGLSEAEDRSLLALGLPFLSLGIFLLFRKQKKENCLREKLLNELSIHKTFSTILKEHLEELINALNEQLEKGELNIDIIKLSDFQGKFDAISEKEEEAILIEEKIEKELNDKMALLSSLSNKAEALTERATKLIQA
tara:strand:+ start:4343 stop:5824 length:1482 start_codon:yes stop_codon:yes gene_type:complete